MAVTEEIADFDDVCLINDLGNEKTYYESGITLIDYYYPDIAASVSFDTETLTCADGSVFTSLEV